MRTLERDGWTIVSVVGEIDLATIPTLRQHVETVAGERIALDLSGVDHLDPIGFGVVVVGALRARRRGALFALICPPGRPRELLAETELDQILTVVDSSAALRD